jgi:hypothetical protein
VFVRAPIERDGDRFRVRLSPEERALLGGLVDDLEALLGDEDDPAVRRLYPDAYADDEAAAGEYRSLVGEELRAGRHGALATLRETIRRDTLTEEELGAWLGVLNDLRLVLGTRLGVTEELYQQELAPNDPRAPEVAVFLYLTWLEETTVAALRTV